jgi:CheY-like chemotaxis protein
MGKTILLIEDNEPLRENTIELLELANYDVLVAENGFAALELIKTKTPDLILCDIMMPEMDGYEFLKNITGDRQPVPVPFIFFTAYSEKTDIQKGMQMGATDYIVKPFNADELIGLIQQHLPLSPTL